MVIQGVLIAAIVVGGVVLLRTRDGHRGQAIRRLLVVALGLFAVFSVAAPSLVTSLAQLVGVGRGADLLLYALTATFFGYTVTSYRRNRHLEEQLTVLARSIALTEATAAHAEQEVSDLRRHEPPDGA